jgi:hypothetical protein
MEKEYNEILKKQIQNQISSNSEKINQTSTQNGSQLAIANSNLFIALSNIAIANSNLNKSIAN